MSENRIIENEIAIRIKCGDDDEGELFDAHYDTIHLYPWIGHAIIRIITEEGQYQLHTSQEHGESIAETAGVEPKIEKKIGRRAWDAYIRYRESTLGEHWLE